MRRLGLVFISFLVCAVSIVGVSALDSATPVSAAGSSFTGLTPALLFETRTGQSTFDGQQNAVGRRSAGQISEVQVAGRAGFPDNALAVVLNVTSIRADQGGFATVFPCGVTRPDASTLNYAPGQVIANGTTVKLGKVGRDNV